MSGCSVWIQLSESVGFYYAFHHSLSRNSLPTHLAYWNLERSYGSSFSAKIA